MCGVGAVIHPLGYIGGKIGGVAGGLFEPTAGLARLAGGSLEGIIDPSVGIERLSKGQNLDGSKDPGPSSKAPIKSGLQIAAEAKNSVLKAQSEERKRKQSLLSAYSDLGTDRSGFTAGPTPKTEPIGAQKLDSILTQGSKSLLGT